MGSLLVKIYDEMAHHVYELFETMNVLLMIFSTSKKVVTFALCVYKTYILYSIDRCHIIDWVKDKFLDMFVINDLISCNIFCPCY